LSAHDETRAIDGTARRPLSLSGIQWIALAVCSLASLTLGGWVLLCCRSGFDFTDEGFYLNWISDPWIYRASVSQFGFVYHPIYRLVGGDIALLRQANVVILFALAWLLCWVLLRSILMRRASVAPSLPVGLAGIALVAASASLWFLQIWLPTPNYNSLTLQSMMLAVTGALLADRKATNRSLAGWVLIGIGGGVAFLAKPTSAAMLGGMLAVYLAISAKFHLRGLLIAVATAILLVVGAAFAIDGSLADFARRIVDGVDLAGRRLPGDHDIGHLFRLDGLVPFAVLAPKPGPRRLSRSSLAIVGLFILLPYAFAFGTSESYWMAAARAGLFWFLAGLVIIADLAEIDAICRKLLLGTVLALAVSAGILVVETRAPYRQTEPLDLQTSKIDLPPGKSSLFLSDDAAAYVRGLRQLAASAGFEQGYSVLDMTGSSPGALYAIGARPLAAPWTLGGYAGSADFVAAALSDESCKAIAVSWMLTEPGSANAISTDILQRVGINLSTDYHTVGSISSRRSLVLSSRRSFAPQEFEQWLLKPTRTADQAQRSCEQARLR
jgi:hypothetical protein